MSTNYEHPGFNCSKFGQDLWDGAFNFCVSLTHCKSLYTLHRQFVTLFLYKLYIDAHDIQRELQEGNTNSPPIGQKYIGEIRMKVTDLIYLRERPEKKMRNHQKKMYPASSPSIIPPWASSIWS